MKYFRIINLALFMFLGLNLTTVAQGFSDSRAGDEQALVDLYNSTDGENWSNQTGWSGSSISLTDDIYGIHTDTIDGELRVVAITLNGNETINGDGVWGGNNLRGTLPSSLGNLTKVYHFDVKHNYLAGEIPWESFNNMPLLETLFLNGTIGAHSVNTDTHPGKGGGAALSNNTNLFTGGITSSLDNLVNLKWLEVFGHPDVDKGLTGAMPANFLENSTEMLGLFIGRNLLTDLSPSISNLKKLIHLNVGRNLFSGSVYPINFDGMSDLRFFRGEAHRLNDRTSVGYPDAAFTGNVPDFSNIPNSQLRIVTFTNQNFDGPFPAELVDGRNPNISTIIFDWNNLTGELPVIPPSNYGQEDQNHYILVFGVNGNNLTGQIPDSYATNFSEHALILEFGWNNFNGPFPQEGWNHYYRLRILRFSGNNLTGSIPKDVPNVRDLFYDNNNFDTFPAMEFIEVYNGRQKKLEIQGNKISWEDIEPAVDFFNNNNVDFKYENQNPDSNDGPTVPSAPSLESPSNGATGVSVYPTFSWSSVSADSYTLRVYTTSGSMVLENTGSNTSYTIPSSQTLDHDTEYSWRVRATLDGLTSEWSSLRSFTTEGSSSDDGSDGILVAPSIKSPSDGAGEVSLTPTLEWSSVEGADSYILHFETATTEAIFVDTEVNGTSYSVNNNESLNPETVYKWRVRGVKGGVEGEWSPIAEFTTKAEDGGNGNNGKGPQKATPAKDEKKVSKKTTFKWESVENAESYTIEVSEASTSTLFVEEEVTDTVYVVTREMKGNTEYVWRVRATVQGQPGEWSDEWEFTTTDENEETTFEVELNQNYPNPFNPTTNIRFRIAEQQQVSLKVYDMAGRLVASLIDGNTLSAGTHSASFNAQSLASGVYFYRLITQGEIVTRKMTLMK